MRILVTGGAGFVGSHLCEVLASNTENTVVSLDNYSTGKEENHIEGVTYITGHTKDIEKHITDDRSKKGRDYFSSLELEEFKEFVYLMKQMPAVIGDNLEVLSSAQNEYRYLMKQQAVANREISEGEKITKEDLSFKRTGVKGISQNESEKLYGKKINKNKTTDEPITFSDFL